MDSPQKKIGLGGDAAAAPVNDARILNSKMIWMFWENWNRVW